MDQLKIRLPYNFEPRSYQLPVLEAIDNGYKKILCVWHRRSGKDKTFINVMAKKMFVRIGGYYYFFPTYKQGKKIIWNGMDRQGFKFTDHIPQQIRKRTDSTDMLVETVNNSIMQIIGTDKIDSVVGTNPIGSVFSEYSLQDPSAWNYVRPIVAENDGFAIFNYTPRGNNHGKTLLDLAKRDPKHWFVQILTVDDTRAIPLKILEQERREMFRLTGNDALFMQEYYCSFDAPVEGAYYGSQMIEADKEHRFGNIPYEPVLPVHTFWDLGVGDSTAIWFVQIAGNEKRLIDYYETQGEGLSHYINILQNKGYVYGEHWAPHDIEVREFSSGKSRRETAANLGINFNIAPNLSIEDGIDSVRNILSSCWFDLTKCEQGINALKGYHKEFDEKNKVYKNKPAHDWASHGADAFRYFAVSYQKPIDLSKKHNDFSNWRI